MKSEKPSITAEGIALIRALESIKPADQRICFDPLARYFVSGWMFLLASFFLKIGYAEKRGPGTREFLIARTRYIDDYLRSSLMSGLQQLVILGAGYDSRPYRFEELRQKRVFEVDHPATQRRKVAKLAKMPNICSNKVTYLAIDFDKEKLDVCLYGNGFNKNLKTLFIWEGVTYYITSESVDKTLDFISKNTACGSSVVFDYAYSSAIDGTLKRGEVSSMRRSSKFTGEKMIFGIEEGTIEEFLKRRGFGQIENVSGDMLKRMYFTGVNETRIIAPVYAIAHATVS
jgi:methyltransferase (TIGR00027 family)